MYAFIIGSPSVFSRVSRSLRKVRLGSHGERGRVSGNGLRLCARFFIRGVIRDIAYLALHGIRVDLAHVNPAILPPSSANVQRPRVVVAVGYRQAGVVRDHVLVNRQDRLGVRFDPRHLASQTHFLEGKEFWFPRLDFATLPLVFRLISSLTRVN